MIDKSKKNLIAGAFALGGAMLIGFCSNPSSSIEGMGIISGIVLLAFGGILRGSIQE